MKVKEYLLSIATDEANKSDVRRSQMSCLALNAGQTGIISKSHNAKIHGYENKWTLHAEERVIAKYRGKIDTILVLRANGNRKSKPCPRCRRMIEEAGIKRVIYFDGDKWLLERI
jgi:deoxycytidylate deaminase